MSICWTKFSSIIKQKSNKKGRSTNPSWSWSLCRGNEFTANEYPIEPIHDFVKTGKQFLGICLGMQLLFSQSEEFGINRGLDLIHGNIVKFPKTNNENNFLQVPQIQWNKIHKSREKEWNNSPLEGINDGEYMYFVHSFYAIPKDENVILSYTEYGGIEYASSVIKDNIVGLQFHPEKSAKEGIKIYQNWASQISIKI